MAVEAVRAPRGAELSCRGWHQEAALRLDTAYCDRLAGSLDEAIALVSQAKGEAVSVAEVLPELVWLRPRRLRAKDPTVQCETGPREHGRAHVQSILDMKAAVLSVMGLVSRSRRGTFVRGADGSDHLEALAYARLAKKGQLADLVEARRILEGSLAAFAAERATEDDIARIRATLDTMKQDGLTPGDFAKTDTEFHLAVVEADPSIQVRARAFHEGIISAIEQEDKERALSSLAKSGSLDRVYRHIDSHLDQFVTLLMTSVRHRRVRAFPSSGHPLLLAEMDGPRHARTLLIHGHGQLRWPLPNPVWISPACWLG